MYDITTQCCVFHRIPPLRWPKNTETRSRLLYRVSQELRSPLRDVLPEPIVSQKPLIHAGPIRKGSGVMNFLNFFQKLERKEEHGAFLELYR